MLLSLRVDKLIEKIAHLFKDNDWMLCAAESCSGGLLAAKITAFPGASEWFETSVVSYSEYAKMQLLGVEESTLKTYGAVSEACALEMVGGIKLKDNNFAVAITGFAGPKGDETKTSVGTVFIAWLAPEDQAYCMGFRFMGDRHQVVLQAIFYALRGCVLKSLRQESYQSLHFFFAVMLEEDRLKKSLYQHALQAGFCIEQLEPDCNLHLTIAFLGKMDGQGLALIKKKASELAKINLEFTLEFSSLNYWKKSDAFVYLFQETPLSLKNLSLLNSQEMFIPHVTISKRSGASQKSIQISAFSATLEVKSFSLMASVNGLFYIEQYTWFLNKEMK